MELGRLLEKNKLPLRGSLFSAKVAVDSIIDAAICFSDIEPDWICPCPYAELSCALKLPINDSHIKNLVNELHYYVRNFIIEELKTHGLDYVFDLKLNRNEQVVLVGAMQW